MLCVVLLSFQPTPNYPLACSPTIVILSWLQRIECSLTQITFCPRLCNSALPLPTYIPIFLLSSPTRHPFIYPSTSYPLQLAIHSFIYSSILPSSSQRLPVPSSFHHHHQPPSTVANDARSRSPLNSVFPLLFRDRSLSFPSDIFSSAKTTDGTFPPLIPARTNDARFLPTPKSGTGHDAMHQDRAVSLSLRVQQYQA